MGAFCRAHPFPEAISDYDLPYDEAESHSAQRRYTFRGASTTGGAVIFGEGRWLVSFHSSDPNNGRRFNSFDLVRECKFGHQDDGIDRDELLMQQWPSYKEMVKLAGVDAATLAELETERHAAAERSFRDVDDDVRATYEEFVGDIDIDPTVKRLNARHSVVAIRGKTLISSESPEGDISFGSARDLDTLYANDLVPIAGSNRSEPVSKYWLRNVARRTYPNGVILAPQGARRGVLNLFRGWAVRPSATASCALFLRHINEVICNGNATLAHYVLGWLAHMIQKPEEKPGVAIVLKGLKATGKDTFGEYLATMIGKRHCPTIANSDHLVGRFNSHFMSAIMLQVQEGSWAGDRKAESTLKYLITSPRVAIEPKGVDLFEIPSIMRVTISANARWVVPASADERRWLVLNISEAHRRDKAYFQPLYDEMEGEGPQALLHYLEQYDISDFDVRDVPETDALLEQKLASLRDLPLWWFEVLSQGEIPGVEVQDFAVVDWDTQWVTVDRQIFRDNYEDFASKNRYRAEPLNASIFGAELRKLVPNLKGTRPNVAHGDNKKRVYRDRFPPLPQARALFESWIAGKINWDL